MAVAIVTGGHIRGHIGPAQSHGFAVIGVAIVGQPVLVAFAAALVTHHFEVAVPGGFDLVGGVAIRANGASFVAFGEELAVDALIVGLLNLDMAFAAGSGEVGFVDG